MRGRFALQPEQQDSHHAGDEAASGPRRRSNFSIMARLMGLTRPLLPVMALAILLGVLGFVAAIFLTVFAAYGLIDAAGVWAAIPVGAACVAVAVCGVVRGSASLRRAAVQPLSRIQDSRARAR